MLYFSLYFDFVSVFESKRGNYIQISSSISIPRSKNLRASCKRANNYSAKI